MNTCSCQVFYLAIPVFVADALQRRGKTALCAAIAEKRPILSARSGADRPRSANDGVCPDLRAFANEGDPPVGLDGHGSDRTGRWPATAEAPAPRPFDFAQAEARLHEDHRVHDHHRARGRDGQADRQQARRRGRNEEAEHRSHEQVVKADDGQQRGGQHWGNHAFQVVGLRDSDSVF